MGNLEGFNADEFKDDGDYAPLPKGDYEVTVIESSVSPTKAGDGTYAKLVLQVVDGERAGRRIYHYCNISNPNQSAEDIGKRSLAQVCRAVGNPTPSSTEDLHDIPFMVKVIHKNRSDNEGVEARVARAYALNDRVEPAPQKAEVAATTGGEKPPWQ